MHACFSIIVFMLQDLLIVCDTRNEGLSTMATSGTFLVEDGPYYFCMLEILFGRLSKSLFTQVLAVNLSVFYSLLNLKRNVTPIVSISQALKKISKFVQTNILPGAVAEVGLLCCACVHSNPEEAVLYLVEPMLSSVISSMKGTPRTGFLGGTFDTSVLSKVLVFVFSPSFNSNLYLDLFCLKLS